MEGNREATARQRADWETLEHSSLKEMFSLNPCPQGSEEVERVRVTGMRDTKEQGIISRTGTHMDSQGQGQHVQGPHRYASYRVLDLQKWNPAPNQKLSPVRNHLPLVI